MLLDRNSAKSTLWVRLARDRLSRPALFVIPALTLVAGLGWGSLGRPVLGAVAGLAWGLLGWALASWVDRSGRWRPAWANLPVAIFIVVILLMFGYGLASSLQQTVALNQVPALVPDLLRPPLGTGLVGFFIAANSLCEWILLPAAVLFNWRISRRRMWVLVGAALFYAFRVWTYLYFGPHILDLVANAPTGVPTPEYLDALRQWLFLNWFRVESLAGIIFLVAAFIPAAPSAALSPRSCG
ncbi:MAG: hypothetical protein ACRDRX_20185 [Pseudonocardiaceae bacterium]